VFLLAAPLAFLVGRTRPYPRNPPPALAWRALAFTLRAVRGPTRDEG
jgi:hypothetical protein